MYYQLYIVTIKQTVSDSYTAPLPQKNNTHREQNDVALWFKKMSHLSKFDRKNWQAFINIFDKQMERHQLNNSIKLEILESNLIGSAFEFYGCSTTKVCSYDALRELMQNQFGSRITSQQLRRTELLTIKQQAGENLVEFLSRVEFIAGEGYTDISEKIVFHRFQTSNLKLKPRKCELFHRKLKFLGWIMNSEGISIPRILKLCQNARIPRM